MSGENLLPCPFCGTQPEWINEALPDSHFYIRCPHCHIVMKEDRRDKVIGMWNRREQSAALKESLTELIKIADYYHDREVTYTDMPYKNWTAAIDRAKKLIAESREQSRQLPPQEQES